MEEVSYLSQNSGNFSSAEKDSIYRFILEQMPTVNSVNELFDRIYNHFGMPIILTDISYHLIAYSGPTPCPDPYWNTIIKQGIAEPDTIINGYYKDGYMDKLSELLEPFDVNWGISKGCRQTTCGVIINGLLEGICSVLYMDEDKLDFALTLNSAIRNASEIYIRTDTSKSVESFAPERTITARMLLEDLSSSVKLIANTTIYKNGYLKPGYVVMAMKARHSANGRLQNLRSNIKNRYYNMLYVNKDDCVYMFFPGVPDTGYLDTMLEFIEGEAKGKLDFTIGVSNVFTSLSDRALYVEQARLALEYGIVQKSTRSVYKFFDNYSGIVMKNGYPNISPQNLVTPEIRALMDADREASGSFYDSFKCYLYTKCDMPKAAQLLFMHRNSLMYRIKRCLEIMNVDLNDQEVYEKLYLCCRVLDGISNSQ